MFYQTRNKIILILILSLFANGVCFAAEGTEGTVNNNAQQTNDADKQPKYNCVKQIIGGAIGGAKRIHGFVSSDVCGKYQDNNKKMGFCVGATYLTIVPVTFLMYTTIEFFYNKADVIKDGMIGRLNITKQHKEVMDNQHKQHINDTMQAYKDVVKIDSEICSQTIDKNATENNTWCDKTRENIDSFLNTMQNTLHNNGEQVEQL